MQVRKIMTKNPACCTPDSTLQEVAHMMEMYDCGCIPVVESHKTLKPVGTITDRDIAIRTFASGSNPLDMKASDIMTTDLATVTPEASVQECLKIMENKQIRRILVTDKGGRVTGIVAQADLAENAAGQTSHFLREVSESDNEHTQGNEHIQGYVSQNRPTSRENSVRTLNTQSFALNETHETHNEERRGKKRRKSHKEKESFFTSTTFLTLLGSIGVGAGIKYYMGMNETQRVNRHKPFTGTQIKTHPVEAPDLVVETPKMKINETTTGFTGANDATTGATGITDTTRTANTGSVTGTRDTFSRTDINNDDDLKPITEVGRTATNT